jgi:CheY-like chemotaxis protein
MTDTDYRHSLHTASLNAWTVPAHKRADFSKLSLLLVDENNFMRRLVKQVCRSFEIQDITDVTDPRAAIALLKVKRVDLVICEYLMRQMSGLAFTKAVRSDDTMINREVPIIMLTGHTQVENILAARDAGVTELLAKPLSPHALLSRLIYVFEHPRPFVQVPGYVGPSRRRRFVEWRGEDRRLSRSYDGQALSEAEFGRLLGRPDQRGA